MKPKDKSKAKKKNPLSLNQKSNTKDLYITYLGKPFTSKKLDGLNAIDCEEDISQIIPGEQHVFLVSRENKIFGLGDNAFGQLAQSTSGYIASPLDLNLADKINISNIYTGPNFAYAFSSKYEVYSWGSNCKGQLGQNHFVDTAVPAKVKTLSHPGKVGGKNQFSECVLNTNEIVVDVSCGALHVLAVTNHNRMFSVGFGETFALGHGNPRTCSVFQEIGYFAEVTHKIDKILCGVSHSACLINGQIYVWGTLGLSKNLLHKQPNTLVIKDDIADFALGDLLTVVLTSKGEVYTVGENIDFQLGYQGKNSYTLEKVKIPYKIEYVSCGMNHVLVISKSSIFAWGSNKFGQINPNSPEKVFENLEELSWLGESVPLNIICGFSQTYIISKQRVKAPKDLMTNPQNLRELKKDTEELKRKLLRLKKENDILKNEIKELYSTLSNMDKSENRMAECDKVITKYKAELRKNRTLQPNYEVDFNELKFGDKLSEGAFGIIYKGMWRELKVAIKTLKQKYLKEETIKDFLSRLKRRMRSNRIIKTSQHSYVSRQLHQKSV